MGRTYNQAIIKLPKKEENRKMEYIILKLLAEEAINSEKIVQEIEQSYQIENIDFENIQYDLYQKSENEPILNHYNLYLDNTHQIRKNGKQHVLELFLTESPRVRLITINSTNKHTIKNAITMLNHIDRHTLNDFYGIQSEITMKYDNHLN